MYHLSFHCPFIDPILLRLGPLSVNWYGVMYSVGALGWYLITRDEILRRRGPIPIQTLPEFLFHGLVGGVIGARLGYALLYNFPFFYEKPWELFAFWHGGMSAHGWLVGMAIGGFLFVREHKVPVRELADTGYLALPLGLMAVKIGNFVNCEGFGGVTTLPWGVVVPAGGEFPRHPTQLYEAVFEGLLLFVMLWRLRLRALQPGDLSCFFFVGYGSLRFMIEFSREPDHSFGHVLGWVTEGQILSLCVIVVGLVGYALPRLNYRTVDSRKSE